MKVIEIVNRACRKVSIRCHREANTFLNTDVNFDKLQLGRILADMRVNFLLILIFLMVCEVVRAGSDPCNAISITPNMLEFESFTIGNGSSGMQEPSCGDYHGTETWFEFTAPASGDVAIQLLEGSIINAAFALYTGDCSAPAELHCVRDYLCGQSDMPAWYFENLDVGSTYYLRVWNEDGPWVGELELIIADPSDNPYITTGNATGMPFQGYSNCIQLTAQANNQVGCAWYPTAVDFDEPFEQQFSIYLGTITGQAGADGMAIIYQINDIPTCGDAGGGLGVLGIPDSWIIEFDTYQNGPPFIDPPQDHTAISINGDLTYHLSGPVTLGSISDGEFHEVICSWDPAEMRFMVWFDGILVHDLVYDIVNDVFGGQNMAWWGVTASTGGSVNQHVLCFDNLELENLASVYTFQEITVCDGESVFLEGLWQTSSGTYVDVFSASNGCDSVVTTELTVLPPTETTHLEARLCPGESVLFDGNWIDVTGVYEVIYIDEDGCDSLVILSVVAPKLEGNLVSDGPLTCSREVVTISFEILESPGELLYFWSTNEGNIVEGHGDSKIVVNQAGLYFLEVYFDFDGIPCGPYEYAILIEENQLFPQADISQEGSIGCDGGLVFIEVINSVYADEYEWEVVSGGDILSGHNDPIVTVNGPGLYLLILTNATTGCQTQIPVEIEQPAESPIVQVNQTDTLSCQLSAVWINGFGSETGSHIEYNWETSDGEIQSSPDSLAILVSGSGTYTLIATDTLSNCSGSSSLTIEFNMELPGTELILSDTLNCRNETVEIELAFAGSTQGFTIDWGKTDERFSFPAKDTSVSVREGGWYYFNLSNQDSSCVSTDTLWVDEDFEIPSADAGPDAILDCISSSVQLSGQQSDPPNGLLFSWSSQDGTLSGETDSMVVYATSPGLYVLEVINSKNGCSDTNSVQVFPDWDLPNFSILMSNPLNCIYSETSLEAEIQSADLPNPLFEWFFANTDSLLSEDATLQVNSSGLYILRLTDPENSCSAEQSIEIALDTTPPSLILEKSGNLNCMTAEVTVAGNFNGDTTGSYDLAWKHKGETIPSTENFRQINVSSGGWYFLQRTNLNSGCSISDSIFIGEDFDSPEFSISANGALSCRTMSVRIEITPDNPGAEYSVQWTDNEGETIQSGNGLLYLDVASPGWYFVELTNLRNGCISEDSIFIEADFELVKYELKTSHPELNCITDTVTLSVSSLQTEDISSIHWYDNSGQLLNPFGNEFELSVSNPGWYSVFAEHLSSGCVSVDSIFIGVDREKPEFEVEVSGELGCLNESVNLSAINYPEDLPLNFIWLLEGEVISQGSVLETDAAGLYEIVVTNELNGCKTIKQTTVNREGLPIDSVHFELIQPDCEIGVGSFFVNYVYGGTPPYSLEFNNNIEELGPITDLPSGDYSIFVIDSIGCTKEIKFEILEVTDLKITLPPYFLINEGDEIQLVPEVNKPLEMIREITWYPADILSCSNCFSTNATPSENIEIRVDVIDYDHCLATAFSFIEIIRKRDVFIPSAFSPHNRDGINDYFFPLTDEGSLQEIVRFRIFDRWGNRVFYRESIEPESPQGGWDGKLNGELISNGVFLYLIELRWLDGKTTTHYGEVHLLN